MPRPAHRRTAAFTMIELMIVLLVIGVMVMTVGPSLSAVLADNRQASAAHDIVRLARLARSMTLETGYAHLLRIRSQGDGSSNALGTVELHPGMTNRCTQTPWATSFGQPVPPSRRLDMAAYNAGPTGVTLRRSDQDRMVIFFEVRVGLSATENTAGAMVCYESSGRVYTSITGQPALVDQAQPIVLHVRRSLNGQFRGEDRQVLFPVGGNARLR